MVYYTDAVFSQVNAVLESVDFESEDYSLLKNRDNWPGNLGSDSEAENRAQVDDLAANNTANLDQQKLALFKQVYNALFDSQSYIAISNIKCKLVKMLSEKLFTVNGFCSQLA